MHAGQVRSGIQRPGTTRSPIRRPGAIRYTKAGCDQIHKFQVRPSSLYTLGRIRYRKARYDRNRKARYDQVAYTKARCDQVYYTKARCDLIHEL